jgi:hypothetical protein
MYSLVVFLFLCAGDPACLFLEDHHLADDAVLESINSLLASGEVPGLYAHEVGGARTWPPAAPLRPGRPSCSLLPRLQELEPLLAPLKEQMGESAIAFRTPYEFFVVRRMTAR